MARTIRREFPKVDETAWVLIKNPSVCAGIDLDLRDIKQIPNENRTEPDDPTEINDPEDWSLAVREVLAGLVLDIHVPDAGAWDDKDAWVSGPVTADMLRHNVPKPIYRWIEDRYVEAIRPQ